MEWTTRVPQVKTRVRNWQRVRGNIGRGEKDYQDNSVIKEFSERDSRIKEYDVYNIYTYMYKVVGILTNQSTYRISVAELQNYEEW